MKISSNHINDTNLNSYGLDVAKLIKESNYKELSGKYGYALSFGKKESEIIRKDLEGALSSSGRNSVLDNEKPPIINIQYMKSNESKLIAIVECELPILRGAGNILVELVVAGKANDYHISMEQISYQA